MKVARFLLLLALPAALAGAARGQSPMVDPSVMAANYGAAPMVAPQAYPGMEMAAGPVYSDCPPYVGREPFGKLRQVTGRGYFSADAFLVHLGGATSRDMATNAGRTTVFLQTSQPDYGVETAPLVTAGYVLNNDIAVEGTAFYKDDLDANLAVSDGAVFTSPIIADILTANGFVPDDYIGADLIGIQMATAIRSYELNIVETSRIFKFLAGFRYMEVSDALGITARETPAISYSSVNTFNHLYGTQLGFRAGYDWELFGIQAGGKAGYFYNSGEAQLQIRDNGNTLPRVNRQTGGDNDAFLGELHAKVSYRPLPFLAFQFGYQCTWLTEVALAPDQLNPTNPNQSGIFLNAHGDLFYHGPTVGMEARF